MCAKTLQVSKRLQKKYLNVNTDLVKSRSTLFKGKITYRVRNEIRVKRSNLVKQVYSVRTYMKQKKKTMYSCSHN